MSSTPCMPATCTLQVPSSERHNTSSLLKVFVLKNLTFSMPSSGIRKRKPSTSCHSWLADLIAKCEKLAMRTCGRCLTGGKECKVLDDCDKCEACVRLGVSCDLYTSSEEINKVSEEINKVSEEINKVSEEILQLEKEKDAVAAQKREMKAKKERLRKQIAFLKKRRLELIHTELQNIEELEAEEQVAADPSNRPSLNFLMPKAFGLDDADWLPADFFAGTGTVSLHNG